MKQFDKDKKSLGKEFVWNVKFRSSSKQTGQCITNFLEPSEILMVGYTLHWECSPATLMDISPGVAQELFCKIVVLCYSLIERKVKKINNYNLYFARFSGKGRQSLY